MPLTQRVLFGSLEHILPIVIAVIVTIVLIRFALNQNTINQNKIFKYLGIFVSGFIAVFHLYQIL